MAFGEQYPQDVSMAQAKNAMFAGAPRPFTFTERLRAEKDRLETRLREVNETIAALESNPEVQRIVDCIQKLGYI